MATDNKKVKQVGRKPKAAPAAFRYYIRFNELDNARFLALFEASGLTDKARFITSCIFSRQLKVVKIDKAAMDYYMRLTTFHSQFRTIGVNYNQVVKHLKTAFSEKMAFAMLYKLEKATIELVTIQKQIVELTEEFERKHLLK
jgi:hypothetical protein